MDLISNDSKHLLRPKTTQKLILRTFYYNNKGTTKVVVSNKYNKPFKLTSWPNFYKEHHILSSEI